VDATGKPRNLMFLHPTGTDLDKFALQTVATDRFNPGSYDGAPAVVAQSVEVNMQACVEEKKDEAGRKNYFLRLTSQPEQKFGALPQPPDDAVLASVTLSPNDFSSGSTRIERVGRGVSAPVLLNFVAAEFSDKARKAKYQGVCVLSLIVDAQGLPQNVRVIRDLGMGLDEKAIEAVNQYRFKPAMKSGAPVPVMINVEVNFKLY
jgi:TonB family protein